MAQFSQFTRWIARWPSDDQIGFERQDFLDIDGLMIGDALQFERLWRIVAVLAHRNQLITQTGGISNFCRVRGKADDALGGKRLGQ
ncbi:Uncharacterised protein [Vibrio cholerae]|nr:Uncharacterised protein [Vibrio cholerae]